MLRMLRGQYACYSVSMRREAVQGARSLSLCVCTAANYIAWCCGCGRGIILFGPALKFDYILINSSYEFMPLFLCAFSFIFV
jgi:hypothetical protein